MSSVQPNLEQLSLKISEVLEDIGVNDEIIQKRRQYCEFIESVYAVYNLISDRDEITFRFGSQSEGTTTVGMNSDLDILSCDTGAIVIDSLSNWQSGKVNLLMIQDETTAPGYCLLQLLRDDVPLAAEYVPYDIYCIDDKGRILLRNTLPGISHPSIAVHAVDFVQNGPASTIVKLGTARMDYVSALYCSQWPVEAKQWLTRDNEDGWPYASLKSQCEQSGCFLVSVDSKISGLLGVEWRISTTLAERYLMFSLNTTHLKCYVLMKIVLKSYDVFHDVISSYMCKTVLLYCVENTQTDFWQDRNLLRCFDKLLRDLYTCIQQVKCPHFIIPENNLMAGKISHSQQKGLLEVLESFIRSEGRILLDMQIDNIGDRLKQKLYHVPVPSLRIMSRIEVQRLVSGYLMHNFARTFFSLFNCYLMLNDRNHQQTIEQLKCKYEYVRSHTHFSQFNKMKRRTVRRCLTLMRTAIGSLMASYSISIQNPIPNKAVELLKSGLDSDVSSSMLKLATVYYRSGNMHLTEDLLSHVDQRYHRNAVMPVCGCVFDSWPHEYEFAIAADNEQVTEFSRMVSYCVCFMFHEIHIVPSELRQEFFKSSKEYSGGQCSVLDNQIELAAVDSLTYLYFMQYKTYNSLGQIEEKLRALKRLTLVVYEEPCPSHIETIYNLLGQCLEQENFHIAAFDCYEQSLKIRPQHNAAHFHISRLKCKILLERIFGQMVWAKRSLFICLFGSITPVSTIRQILNSSSKT